MEGADAIGLAVLATTASIVVVFLPTSFMGGMPGQFFIEFGITVAVAVVFSLLVARFVSPLMAAYFLKPSKAHLDARKLPGFYENTLKWALRHRLIASFFGFLTFVGAIVSAMVLPAGFIPTEDPGYIMFNISAPPGSTREQMERSATELSELLEKQPDTKDVFITIGSGGAGGQAAAANGGGGGAGMSSGSAILVMDDHHKMHTEELKQLIRPQLAGIADIRVTALMSGGGPTGSDVNILLTSEDGAALEKAQLALLNEMKDLDDIIRNPRLSPDPPGPELIIRPRTAEAARLNVSTDAIAQVARIATSGDIEANTPKFSEGERRLAIRVRLPDGVRRDLAQLGQLRVPTLSGGSTTLDAVADISYEAGPGVIQRMDRQRMAAVQADFAPGVTSGDATNAVDGTKTMKEIFAGEGLVKRARVGQEQAMNEMFSGIIVALLAGIALIYSVMVLLFKSVFKPMVILSSLPLSFSGAFVALLIFGKAIDMPVMIGLVLLLGIAAKNAILLVEFAIESEQRGNNVYDALFDACRERARPIVMTTVAMSAGMLPTALGLGEGAGFRTSMAIAVIGGLISSTVLSLILVPVVYTFVDSIERWFGSWAGNLTTKPTEDDRKLMKKHNEGGASLPAPPITPAE
jgi:HAE1 family hydrophobic/amphiphilic exporter-1